MCSRPPEDREACTCALAATELARRDPSELEVFRDLRPGLKLGLGVVDIKDNGVESPEEIARRIERAVGVLGAERINRADL